MITPSVNIVQSAFPEGKQGEISGLSHAVSNLGSAIGTAVAGTILVSGGGAVTTNDGARSVTLHQHQHQHQHQHRHRHRGEDQR